MSKKRAGAKKPEGEAVPTDVPVGHAAAAEHGAQGTVEQKMVDFAEDLGTLLGSAEKKATEWLSQRQSVADQLIRIRDTANALLSQLTGATTAMAGAPSQPRRRGRPPGSVNKTKSRRGPGRPKGSTKGRRKMSADARARIAAAQKARWAKLRGEGGQK